jgi:hypothetical protein
VVVGSAVFLDKNLVASLESSVNEIVKESASPKFSSSRSASLLNNESERKGEVKE